MARTRAVFPIRSAGTYCRGLIFRLTFKRSPYSSQFLSACRCSRVPRNMSKDWSSNRSRVRALKTLRSCAAAKPKSPDICIRYVSMGKVYVGMSGWQFDGWRGDFYPKDVTIKRQLEYASRQVTSIEVNGTFYSLQKPETFQKWYNETPPGFV